MTVDEWLHTRAPAPPPRLSVRVRDALNARLMSPASEIPVACVDAACEMLRSLVERPNAGREAALDLLAADALVTYAFEAMSSDANELSSMAQDSMRRIAALAPARS